MSNQHNIAGLGDHSTSKFHELARLEKNSYAIHTMPRQHKVRSRMYWENHSVELTDAGLVYNFGTDSGRHIIKDMYM